MLKRHLRAHHYDPDNRIAWEQLRNTAKGAGMPDHAAYGGTDIGKITGHDPYTSPLVFFYKETGFYKYEDPTNLNMYRGQVGEEHIYRNYFRFFDPENPTYEQFLDNALNGRVIRNARRKNALVINPKYPHLFYNVDYLIPSYHPNPHGILELKSMNGYEMDKYKAGIPTNYVQQTMTYMGGLEMKYGEIFVLRDHTAPVRFEFHYDHEAFMWVNDTVTDFAQKVIQVKQLYANDAPQDEIESLISENEPPVVNYEAYVEYLDDVHKPENLHEVQGTDEVFNHVVGYLKCNREINEVDKRKTYHMAKIKEYFLKHKATHIAFKNYPKVSWKKKPYIPSDILDKWNELIENN